MMSGDLFVSLLKTVYCPVERQLLTQAVNLLPCCHKINQAAAERMYGKSIAGECELKGERCVICKGNVTGYAPDQTIRTQAALIFGNKEKLKLEEFFGQPPLALEEIPEPMAFPGNPAIFELIGHPHTWMLHDHAIFRSTTKDSLIEDFIIMRKDNGDVGLTVSFKSGMKFEDYMLSCGIALWYGSISPASDNTSCFHTSGSVQCWKLLRILTDNNTIPSVCLEPLLKWASTTKTGTTLRSFY